MSDSVKHKYSRGNKPGRHNIYGLCTCVMCKSGRHSFRFKINKLKKRWRKSWKLGKEFIKGIYTD